MYNRYIPQPDGSYKKDRMQENLPRPKPKPPQSECPPLQNEVCTPPPEPRKAPPAPPKPRKQKPQQNNSESITGFFKQLLPKDLDTGDLLIILLLLLMAGDCEESRNNALLTLALYFFM